ncbi:hypothetical protein CAC42_3432 [Sphaceloma murrayae]|uniref:Uncharacterized protein n=1 Tax=Sphaceloma murrayae TaxID=2082308 RepID=A0A2K1R1C3_9PEZI|nr:hypothetical protein CAC42_3432 [Sphaceloma murrayae]
MSRPRTSGANPRPDTDELSEYSLDLTALSSRSAPPSPPAIRKIDEVRSEDIDGPSDFTLNMEDWMRGTRQKGTVNGTMGRGTARGTLGKGTRGGKAIRMGTVRGLFSVVPEDDEPGSARGADDGRAVGEKEVVEEEEEKQREDTPVPEEVEGQLREGSETPRAESSDLLERDWRAENRFLQPTVEDYHSELSPGRPLSAPPGPRPSPLVQVSGVEATGPPVPLHGTQSGESEVEKLRREVVELRALRERSELRAQHFEEQMKASDEARKELQGQLERSTDALRAMNQEQTAGTDPDAQEGDRTELVRSLQVSAEETEQAKRELGNMKTLADELKTQLDEMRESEDAELHDLRWRVKSLVEGEKRLTDELTAAKENVRRALDEVFKLKSDLDIERKAKDVLQDRLHAASMSAPTNGSSASDSELHALKAELDEAKRNTAKLQAQVDQQQSTPSTSSNDELLSARQEIAHLREELDLLQDLSRLDADEAPQKHARTESTASSRDDELRTQLEGAMQKAAHFEGLVREYTSQIESLREELSTNRISGQQLKDALAEAKTVAAAEVDVKLRESEGKRLELHGLLDNMRIELDGLRKTNDEMDLKVSESLRKREEGWKIMEMEWQKERKVMVKALMRQWGREELGIDGGREQRYEYRFMGRPKVTS